MQQATPVATLLIESIEEYFSDENSTLRAADVEACASRLEEAVLEEEVGFAQFIYAQFFKELYLEADTPSYDGFRYVYDAFALSPALFPSGDGVVSRGDKNLSLINSVNARRSFKELEYDLVASRFEEEGVISLAVADSCLFSCSFPGTQSARRLDFAKLRGIGASRYAEAGHHLQESRPRWSRASWYLAENFVSVENSLSNVRKRLFGPRLLDASPQEDSSGLYVR